MTDTSRDDGGLGRPTDDDLAADYVLGLLPPQTETEVARRISVDTPFARMVESWRMRLRDFDISAEQIAPSPTLWQSIERGIATPPVREASRSTWFTRWWHDLAALRLATAGATAVAILCAGLATVFYRTAQNTAATKPVYVAILVSDTTRQAGAVVNTFADGHAELLPLIDIDVPAGRALQVWTLWDRGVGPRSVGLIDRAHSVRLELDRLPTTVTDQLFEITLEPTSGSPIGRPTGPILYKGTTARAL